MSQSGGAGPAFNDDLGPAGVQRLQHLRQCRTAEGQHQPEQSSQVAGGPDRTGFHTGCSGYCLRREFDLPGLYPSSTHEDADGTTPRRDVENHRQIRTLGPTSEVSSVVSVDEPAATCQ